MTRSHLSLPYIVCAALIAACAQGPAPAPEPEAPTGVGSASARPSRSSHVVRTQFSFPVEDHQLIETLQTRGLRQGLRLTKNQIVRAGLRVLDAMTPGEFGEVVEQSKPMKPGRKPSSWSTSQTPVPRSYRSAGAGKSALRGSEGLPPGFSGWEKAQNRGIGRADGRPAPLIAALRGSEEDLRCAQAKAHGARARGSGPRPHRRAYLARDPLQDVAGSRPSRGSMSMTAGKRLPASDWL